MHEKSKPIFWEKEENINLSFAALATRVVMVKRATIIVVHARNHKIFKPNCQHSIFQH